MGKKIINWIKELFTTNNDNKCKSCEHNLWDCICDPPCNLDCKCEKICEYCLNEPCDCTLISDKHE